MKKDNRPTSPSPDQPVSDANAGAGRRKLVKGIAAGGGIVTGARFLPGEWSKPVVESVVLPAHAQATSVQTQAFTGTVDVVNTVRGVRPSIMDFLIQRAEAGIAVEPCPIPIIGTICIEITDSSVEVNFDGGQANGTLSGNTYTVMLTGSNMYPGAMFTIMGTRSGDTITGTVTAPCEDIDGPKDKEDASATYTATLQAGLSCASVAT